MSFFNNSRGATLYKPKFFNVGGDVNVLRDGEPLPSSHQLGGLDILRLNVANDAFHDSAARENPPRCHPQTRLTIINDIKDCIQRMNQEDAEAFIIWLYGPAGSGKSAIVQTIAEFYANRVLVTSFFFSRTGTWSNNTSQFVASIAYQLCDSIPEIGRHIAAAVAKDPLILSRNLRTQMKALIVEPLNEAAGDLQNKNDSQPRVVVVDGLDEARGDAAQIELIEGLAALKEQLHHIPFVFLISSRAEPPIRQAFNTKQLKNLVQQFELGSQYHPADDIRIFLLAEFTRIKELNPSLNDLSAPWPSPEDVGRLVEKSSGQFIYAATVMKYIASPENNPIQSLRVILGFSNYSTNENPFAQLDAVYKFILDSTDKNKPKVLDILALIFLQTGYVEHLSIRFIEELLGYNPGDVKAALANMHALIHVPSSDDSALYLYHASLHHYLTDRSEMDYRLDVKIRHVDLARRLFRFITTAPLSEYKKERFIALLNGFINHYLEASKSDDLMDDLKEFSLTTLLSNVPLSTFYATKWDAFFEHLRNECEAENKGLYRRLLGDFDTWIRIRYLRYPKSMQRCMSAACAIPQTYTMDYLPDIFEIITHALPFPEANRIRRLDDDALMFRHMSSMKFSDLNAQTTLQIFFANRARARTHCADEAKFVKLAKKIVRLHCRRNASDLSILVVTKDRTFEDYDSVPDKHPTLRIRFGGMDYFRRILRAASRDLKLARLLWNTLVQVMHSPRDVIREGKERMAIASLDYIKRCGIKIPEHAHKAHCNICANHRPTFLSLSMPLQSVQYFFSGEWRHNHPVYAFPYSGISQERVLFRNSPNTIISGRKFMPVNRGNIISGHYNGFQILLDNVALGALHDSAERVDVLRSNPDTRVAVLAEVMEWIKFPKGKCILWLYGPPGTGKTTIAQSVADTCTKEGLLAASFFFSRTSLGRNDSNRFIPTLVYQLIHSIPEIKEDVITAIEEETNIFSRSLLTQIQMLVVKPLKKISVRQPLAVVLDGLDECGPTAKSQIELLTVLGMVIPELQHIPIIFLVASRPEDDIRLAFNGRKLGNLVKRLELDNAEFVPGHPVP